MLTEPENKSRRQSIRLDVFSDLPGSAGRCPICGVLAIDHVAPYPSEKAPFRKWVAYYCSHCGSGHVRNGKDMLGDYYGNSYATENRRDRDVNPEKYFTVGKGASHSRYANRAISQIQALRDHGAQFERVLDYGSGPGYFLHHSKAAEKHAVELDEMSYKYLDYLGAQRHDPEALPQDYFDVVVSSHVIEHFTDQNVETLVRSMFRALRPGGRLLVEVPNGALSLWLLPSKQAPHTLFFTNEGIRTLVERCGGQVIANYVRAKNKTYDPQPNPIYQPATDDDFASVVGGGLTIIAERKSSV